MTSMLAIKPVRTSLLSETENSLTIFGMRGETDILHYLQGRSALLKHRSLCLLMPAVVGNASNEADKNACK